ncbi:hypothetical protein M9458_053738, partial [Cirrhinus mrigala]
MHAHSGQSPLRSTQPKVAAPYENGKALQHCWFPRAGLATRAGRYVPRDTAAHGTMHSSSPLHRGSQ